jgi:hypothetical protein
MRSAPNCRKRQAASGWGQTAWGGNDVSQQNNYVPLAPSLADLSRLWLKDWRVFVRTSTVRDRVIKEIQLIPEEKLDELFDFLHHFRLGLKKRKNMSKDIMDFAGSWKDMTEEQFGAFMGEIEQRREDAFTRRRNGESGID